MNSHACPNCGALLPVCEPGTVESCRFCGAEGRTYAAVPDESISRAARPVTADASALRELCERYVENVRAHMKKAKVLNRSTGLDEQPDERLMRAIEDKIPILDRRKDEFRQEVLHLIDALAVERKVFDYATNGRLRSALESYLSDAAERGAGEADS